MGRIRNNLAVVLIGLLATACSEQKLVPDRIHLVLPRATVETEVPGIAQIGKWMIDPNGNIANWGGIQLNGRTIHEAINVIFVDKGATSMDDAKLRLINALTAAGYPARYHHSSGYRASIDGEVFSQLPSQDAYAFSNRPYLLNNNHGRVFGPKKTPAGWVFTAAFSRENVNYLLREHVYASFDSARDDVVMRLDQKSIFKRAETVQLNNGSSPDYTTGDHDGSAIVMRAQ
jgi:hypothetical protein